ncbi:MFS general substrate transporter [Neurospora crassa]|uniref:MFS general substrate transporter n=1 Tax=Neurospora crassa (strain ATCC 24698 / 74-OR23-1A / CBS 708.71 / DSM 1257 / FGSC 987) TaxID=367110 RepID=Q7SH73_NEUCR|nr:hypothetical protein NCU02655 [Neurospora crassa OR74A]EAA36192.2 hypothetical protein NCU02655 [Neurospora crassa OR74A]KHE90096.1 MFS general substrate transporter [Neurospora crassa]|eukprot:XP_965428.2 hypothetical protein NCU02655 [Neurospora crassa OR74A]
MTLPSYRHDSNENNDVHSLSDITEEIHRTDRTVSNKSFAVGFSKVSDIYGRRNLLAIAWVFFAGFSVWIAARALQGIGGSGLYSLAQVCLLEQGPSKPEMVGALVGITLSISYVLGPLLGGGISAGWTWRGIFWINVPCGALALIGIYSLWPDDCRRQYDGWTGIRKIDFVGNFLLILASILLVFGIQEAGSVTFLTGLVYISLVIKIPERFQVIYGDSALRAGIHLLPMLGSCAFGSTLAGSISKKRNLTSHTLTSGNSLQVIGLGLVYRFSNTTERGDIRYILGFTAIYGFGVGLCFAACTMIAAIEARHGDLAAAQGAVAQVRVLGGSLGLSICTIIFNDILQTSLGPATEAGRFPATVLDQLHRSPLAVFMLPPEQQVLVKKVYSDAFRYQMLLMMAVVAVAVLASLGTYRSKPPAVVDSMIHHKALATRPSDTELESASSVRSLVRGVS